MIRSKKSKMGFTLIELLIAITIMGILIAILLVSFSQVQRRGRDTDRSSDLQEIASSLQRYYTDNSHYPTSDSSGKIRNDMSDCHVVGTTSLTWGTDGLNCSGKTYIRQLPKDPQGSLEYCYQSILVGTNVQRYNLYAKMEGQGNLNPEATCAGNSYNYRVTPND